MMGKKEKIRTEKEGIIEGIVRMRWERWRIIGVYVKEGIEQYLRKLERLMKEKREGDRIIIGGGGTLMQGQKERREQREKRRSIDQEKRRIESQKIKR